MVHPNYLNTDTRRKESPPPLPVQVLIIPSWLTQHCADTQTPLSALTDLNRLLTISTVEDVSFYSWVNLYAHFFLPISVNDFKCSPIQTALETLMEDAPEQHQALIQQFDRFFVKASSMSKEHRLNTFLLQKGNLGSKQHTVTIQPTPVSYGQTFPVFSKTSPIDSEKKRCHWSFRWIDGDILGFFMNKQPQMTIHGMVDDLLYHLTGRFDFQQVARTELFKQYLNA